MRWQRAARLGVAAAGLTTAVALYALSRERPAVERPPAVGPSDPAATTQSGPCVQLRYRGDTEHYRLECGASRTYPDRFEFDQVHMTFKDDGTELWAGVVVARGATGDAAPTSLDMAKGVRLRTGEGASVEGEEATYEDASGLTRIPGAVKFTRGRFSGSGTGAVYERHAGVFRILADARVVSTPAEDGGRGAGPVTGPPAPAAAGRGAAVSGPASGGAGETPIEATSTSLVFNRAANALMLEGNAVIDHKPDKMTADRATLYLSDDGERFRVIELRTNSRVIPDPAGGSKTPDMRAQDIDLAFHDGTQTLQRAVLSGQGRMVLVDDAGRRSIEGNVVNLTTGADGATLTHLEAHERVRVESPASATTPARVITAANLLATGADQTGLTAATFSGGVRFVETTAAARGRTASERTGTAQTLVMKLKGKLDSIDEAQFQQNVEFREGSMTGRGDIGTYSVTGGRLKLESNPRAAREDPWVQDDEVQVGAKRFVEVDLNSRDVWAEQDVKTTRTSKPGSGRAGGRGSERSGPALFGGDASIYGFGEQFRYDRAKQVIVYRGTPDKVAHVKQEESDVYGVEITLDDANRDLIAIGKVRSVMPVESSSPTAARGRTYTATAERMVYRDRARTVTYNGIPVKLETPEATTLAAEVVLTLMADSNKLERMRATHDAGHPSTAFVESTLSEGHRTLSEVLEYEAATDRYTFTGRGFVLRMRDADGRCSESRGNFGTFTPADRNVVIPLGPRNPGKVFLNTSVPCSDPLKP